jgi:hypothetical protein
MNFIKTAMFYAPNYSGQDPKRKAARSPTPPHDDLYQVPDVEEEELRQMQRRELSKLFNKVDTSRR